MIIVVNTPNSMVLDFFNGIYTVAILAMVTRHILVGDVLGLYISMLFQLQ